MTHFSRACVSHYFSSVVTMSVSRIVSEIFSVGEWRGLKICVRDRSRTQGQINDGAIR